MVAEKLLNGFKQVAVPYFLNNSSVARIDQLINTKPEECKVHTQDDNQRIIKGIIAAKLNNNPSLEKLIRIYDQQLIDRDMLKETMEEMIRLKNILQTMIAKTE